MVMMICSSEPFPNCLQCILHSAPWTSDDFATFLANSNVDMWYMFLGCFPARIPMVRFSWCVVQLMNSRCVHLSQELANLLPTTISTSVLLKLLFILIFHSCSMSSFLKSALTYCYMQQGWFPTVVAPIHVSISSTLLRLRNLYFTFMLFKFL